MQDGVFDLMNWWLVFWEVVALAVVVFLIVFFVLAVRFLIRANRGDGVVPRIGFSTSATSAVSSTAASTSRGAGTSGLAHRE